MNTNKTSKEIITELIFHLELENGEGEIEPDKIFSAFLKDLKPQQIISAEDKNFQKLLLFNELTDKLSVVNKFAFYDLTAKIYLQLNDIENGVINLKRSWETEHPDPTRLANEALYYFLKDEKVKVKKVTEKFTKSQKQYLQLKPLSFEANEELQDFLENLKQDNRELMSDPDLLMNISRSARELGLPDVFREYLDKLVKTSGNAPATCNMSASLLYGKLSEDNNFDPNFISQTERADLQMAEEHLEILTHNENISQIHLPLIYYKLSKINNLIGDQIKALHFFNMIDTEFLNRENILFKVDILLREEKFQEADKEVNELIKSDPKDSELIALKAEINLQEGKYENALGICGTGLKYASPETRKPLILAKAKALHFLKGSYESEECLMELYEATNDIDYIMNILFINKHDISLRKVAKYFVSHINKVLLKLNRIELNRLAMFFYEFQIYELAVKLLNMSYYPRINTELARAYLISLYKMDKKMNALKIAQELRITGKNEELIVLETLLLEDSDHLDYAVQLAKSYHQKNSNQTSAITFCKYLIKSDRPEKARELLDEIKDLNDLPVPLFDQYLYCLIKLNEPLRAFSCLNKYCDISSKQFYSYFISRFFILSRLEPVREFFKDFRNEVKEDSGVVLKNEDNAAVYIIIDNNFKVESNISPLNSDLAKELIGKKETEACLVEHNSSEKLFRIAEIMHKSVLKWKLLTMTVSDEFTYTEQQLENYDLKLEEIEEIMGKGAQLLADFTVEQRIFTDMYFLTRVNFGVLSTLQNINLVNTIFHIFFDPEIDFLAAKENHFKFTNSKQALEDTDLIMLDLTACIMLTHLDLWREVVRCFKRIYVTRSTINQLEISIRENAKQLGRVFEKTGLVSEQIKFIKTSKTQEDNWQKNIYMIISFIERNCHVIEASSKFDLKPYKQKLSGLSSLLREEKGNCFTDSMSFSHLYNSTYYTEDPLLRKIARDSGLNTVWSQPLLAYIFKRKIIPLDKYFLLSTELLNINYGFIHITIPLLMKALKQSSYKLDETMIYYLDRFFSSNLKYVINIGSWFLFYAIKSFPMFMEANDLIMAFYSRFYSKTKSLDKLKDLINLIYKRTGHVEISNLLLTNFIKFKKYY